MATPRAWTVDRHDPIEKHEDNLWSVVGDIPGMPLRRRMTLAEMRDGRVVVHNAIAVDELTVKAIEAWGEPAVLIVPNGFHRLDAHAWRERFSKSSVICPPAARKRVGAVVHVDSAYDGFAGDETVRVETLEGVGGQEGVLTVKSGERVTLVFNDMLFNQPHLPGSHGWVMKNITDSTGGPKVTRIARWFLMKDRAAFQSQLARLSEVKGLTRLVPGHGENVERAASETLRSVAQALG